MWGYHRLGFCMSGFSADISKVSELFRSKVTLLGLFLRSVAQAVVKVE